MKRFGKEQTTHLFAVGDKVYPMKIDVNVAKDSVTLGIVACDTCNKTDPPTYNKANVVFQFPKGSLADRTDRRWSGRYDRASAHRSAMMTRRQDRQGRRSGARIKAGSSRERQDQGQQAGPARSRSAAAEPVSIEKGMTMDQVEAAMGKPDKKVKLGVKEIYYYKDMKVIFMSGKVSDVQ